MRLPERLLVLTTRDPDAVAPPHQLPNPHAADSLALLHRVFPDLDTWVGGKRVLDHGSGTGEQTVALAQRGAEFVVGVDTNAVLLPMARARAERAGVTDRVQFTDALPADAENSFDVVISQNSMEHFPDPPATLAEIKRVVKPGGPILMTFGPPWLAPFGSHMDYFTPLPWVNILFSEDAVLRVRARYRNDGATRYEDVEGGLNRMTVAKFERIIAGCGLAIEYQHYECSWGLTFLSRIPAIRELFVNHISCVLRRPAG